MEWKMENEDDRQFYQANMICLGALTIEVIENKCFQAWISRKQTKCLFESKSLAQQFEHSNLIFSLDRQHSSMLILDDDLFYSLLDLII